VSLGEDKKIPTEEENNRNLQKMEQADEGFSQLIKKGHTPWLTFRMAAFSVVPEMLLPDEVFPETEK
jgi:hypothetical protein